LVLALPATLLPKPCRAQRLMDQMCCKDLDLLKFSGSA